ncbi:hypothetical protein MBLNU230_g5715t1 [Neophaeotheca triangularis]
MEAFPEHFLGLPIIITDDDAISTRSTNTTTSASPQQTSPQQASTPASSQSSSSTSSQTWQADLTTLADGLWNAITNTVKQKLRAACAEVLRRTDDPEGREWKVGGGKWGLDEDARFLD